MIAALAVSPRADGADKPVVPPRTDLYGDPLPEGAIARMGSVRWRHCSSILAVRFSPDGKILATGGNDSIIRLWNATTGQELRQLAGHRQGVYSLTYSPDGRTLA